MSTRRDHRKRKRKAREHVQVGVTVAVPGSEVIFLSPEATRESVKDLADQLLPEFKVHVGGAIPAGPLQVDWKGPVDDPIQGLIYALSLTAPFYVDDLPENCEARRTLMRSRGERSGD